ncbi:MAG TPA: putative basic amino acid antiporter YfcC [Spirochaetales bacterium]|nr:putative basic amino acid antiporter YfcC [Spirochaetales bacterium]HRY53281.1 putative basic amino acid antiporter YfcC [Spirochaetia bacterium]HRZ64476.1 putative basic amino acid antiporter YfcC [Spirochaetia bacterium]
MSDAVQKPPAQKAWRTPHTYVIIFFVVLAGWIATLFVPVGLFDTHKVSYKDQNGKEKSKTVLIPTSFRKVYSRVDAAVLAPKLDALAADDKAMADAGLDKAKVQALAAAPDGDLSVKALAEAGLTEPVVNGLWGSSVYDKRSAERRPAKVWGTEDYNGFGFLNYLFEGLCTGDKWGSAVGIVAFVLVIGGAFGIIMRTGAIDAGIYSFIRSVGRADLLVLPLLFVLFSLGGAVFGMSEECIAFATVVVPLMVGLGYDSLVGVGVTFVASQVGNAASWMNPFGVAVAQGIAGVPVLSGAGFRMIMWVVTTLVSAGFLFWYGMRIKKNPKLSPVYESDEYFRQHLAQGKDESKKGLSLGDWLVLGSFVAGIVWIVWGVMAKGYYIPEIASQFFVMGLVAGIVGVAFKLGGMKVNDIATSFGEGVAGIAGAAVVVGMAKGFLLVLGGTDAGKPAVLNTILNATGGAIAGLPKALCAWFMYLFQTVFDFFVTSNSGQAALTMPILAPLSDIIGVSRQNAVLAYQMGSGFADAIVPTSASLMGVLAVARVGWGTYAKWQIKMQGFFFVIGSIFMILAVAINFS